MNYSVISKLNNECYCGVLWIGTNFNKLIRFMDLGVFCHGIIILIKEIGYAREMMSYFRGGDGCQR